MAPVNARQIPGSDASVRLTLQQLVSCAPFHQKRASWPDADSMTFAGSHRARDQATAVPGAHAAAQLLKLASSQVRALSPVAGQVGTDKSSALPCTPS